RGHVSPPGNRDRTGRPVSTATTVGGPPDGKPDSSQLHVDRPDWGAAPRPCVLRPHDKARSHGGGGRSPVRAGVREDASLSSDLAPVGPPGRQFAGVV